MNIRRFRQVWHYAKKDSIKIKEQNGKGYLYRLNIFLDMIYSYLKYNMCVPFPKNRTVLN